MKEDVFNMLVLSDMHYCEHKDYTGPFNEIFDSLIECLNEFWNENTNLIPNCIILAGDLGAVDYAHPQKQETPGELGRSLMHIDEKIESLIARIQEKSVRPIVVSTPGNHDKKAFAVEPDPYSRRVKDLNKIETFYEVNKFDWINDNEVKFFKNAFESAPLNGASAFLHNRFGEYVKFASKYSTKYINDYDEGSREYSYWKSVPENLEKMGFGALSGCMIFPNLNVCVATLNSEMHYIIKEDVLFGCPTIIDPLLTYLRTLRREGYAIITVMHRSPYKMSMIDIYGLTSTIEGEKEKCSLVDRIIKSSDLIICGHDHRPVKRRPDILEGSTSLIQNGYIFEQKNFAQKNFKEEKEKNKDHKKKDIYYSVSLLSYAPKSKILTSIDFKCGYLPIKDKEACTYIWESGIPVKYFLNQMEVNDLELSNEEDRKRNKNWEEKWLPKLLIVHEDPLNALSEQELISERIVGDFRTNCKVVVINGNNDVVDLEKELLSKINNIKNEWIYVAIYINLKEKGKWGNEEKNTEIPNLVKKTEELKTKLTTTCTLLPVSFGSVILIREKE